MRCLLVIVSRILLCFVLLLFITCDPEYTTQL